MDTSVILDSGHTAWMIVATLLVFMMTIPGIALFYGGLVRQKNMLSLVMQSLAIAGVVSILWVAFGYSLAFGTGYEGSGFFKYGIGGFDKVMLNGIGLDTLTATGIPEMLFVMFQCMFALITPALILGAFAERVRFAGFLCFTVLWSILVYMPMAHWVWGGGFLMEMGAVDFAGGTVVHINAGVAALVMALMVGRRKDYRAGRPITPHNIPFVFLGTALLWLGWFGFNAGSGLAADGLAANAFLVTHIATCMAAVTWAAIDWAVNKKCTTVGACTGAVAGLVAITPAAGSVDLFGALCIGLITSAVCFWMVAVVKPKFGYDDALDAFGVHGVGGIIGSILTGVFATRFVTGEGGVQGALYGDWNQLWIQVAATVISMAFSAVMTFVLFKVVDKLVGIRVDKRVEEEGLDIYEHGESAYDL
ncbi:ammonia channel [Paraprevotella xylaniphila YIT 11841]|uniref:Ammonium transporter n=1 Tax=Paraprevotella xylaniphila YIT 11841 TaxID=762982 RepID=F3QPR6_9BACT|nr:ammonium transporter [Paraprevotella xylaniphila]EGG57841.1 ammonia channel [Paraprevotella xylaniphila YIT 11841]